MAGKDNREGPAGKPTSPADVSSSRISDSSIIGRTREAERDYRCTDKPGQTE